jgi:glycosyltransferase involved in cell wall biosynthesis
MPSTRNRRGWLRCMRELEDKRRMKKYGFKPLAPSQQHADAVHLFSAMLAGPVTLRGRADEFAHLRYGRVLEKPLLPSLPLYPLDVSSLLALSTMHLDQRGVFCLVGPSDSTTRLYHPRAIAQYALAHWNAYLLSGQELHRDGFLRQVEWLLTHELCLSDEVGVWPVPYAIPAYHAPVSSASASTQGCVLSAMIRAYQLTGSEIFLLAARRAVGAYQLDILDGGIAASIGEDGLFFEEVAVYPAAHILSGCLLALLGLYDYVGVTQDGRIELLIERCISTLHLLLNYFDTGYWSRYDLLHEYLAPEFYHTLHATLLEILGHATGCDHCLKLAARWHRYACRPLCSLRSLLSRRMAIWWDNGGKSWLRAQLLGLPEPGNPSSLRRVCVPLPLLPEADHTRNMLNSIAQVMELQWQISYLVQHPCVSSRARAAKQPTPFIHPWRFPGILLYGWHGGWQLLRLVRQGEGYHLLLPQDGIVCAAFAGLVGKLAGIRVVCMDSGSMLWPHSPAQPSRRALVQLPRLPWYERFCRAVGTLLYRPSLRLLAAIAARCCDQFLLANEEVAEIYRTRFKVRPDRITRLIPLVDAVSLAGVEKGAKLRLRVGCGLSPDVVLIALAHRPLVEVDLSVALEGIALALRALPPLTRTCVRVLIAEDRLRQGQVIEEIKRRHLEDVCWVWGEARPEEIRQLLTMADIFLSVGTRQADDTLTVLEAMAAGCAVVATRTSLSHARLLTEGRGISVLPNNPAEIGIALTDLSKDLQLCSHMGSRAREYVAHHHTIQILQRNLLRASFFAPTLAEARKRVLQ